MSKQSHTPGPFFTRYIQHIGESSKNFWGIYAPPEGGRGAADKIARVYKESDANLIAAAPEMLEALELILIQRENFDDEAAKNIYELATEAIAKARGEG